MENLHLLVSRWCVRIASTLVVFGGAVVAAPPEPVSPSAEPNEPLGPSASDEALQIKRYNAWILQWLTKPLETAKGPRIRASSPFTAMRASHDDLPNIPVWPFDESRGMLVNDIERRINTLTWIDVGLKAVSDPISNSESWMGIALADWNEPTAIRAVMCVPEACYFRSSKVAPKKGRVIIRKPGIWIALREHEGNDVLAGILIHKTAPKKPLEHKLFKKWLVQLKTRYPLPAR